MVLHSLRSLPSVQTHVLFRGVKLSAADLGAEYRTGECFLWSGFTSTTTTIESTQKFLGFVFLAWVLIRGDRSPRRSCAKPPACQCQGRVSFWVPPARSSHSSVRQLRCFALLRPTSRLQVGDRTLFILNMTQQIGTDLRPFSLHPGENEVLLPPNLEFEVEGVLPSGDGLTMLQCRQVTAVDSLLAYT